MKPVFLVSLIAGLLLAVRIMLFGVERRRDVAPTAERSFRLSPAVVAAFAVAFGVTGYVTTVRSTASPVVAAIGALASVATAHLVRRWWTVTPEHDIDDERYVLQGHVARVVKTIEPAQDGEVAFDIGSERRVVRARTLDQVTVARGAEVVIERIEGDVAYVEPWVEVEKRL